MTVERHVNYLDTPIVRLNENVEYEDWPDWLMTQLRAKPVVPDGTSLAS